MSVARSGEEALKIFAEEKPDLALLDVVLPGIDGIEVLRQIKNSSPATIVLMMSAYHMVDRAVEAMKLGAYDYLIKPFHLADMVNTIQRATEMLALRVRVHDTVESAKGRYDFGRVVTAKPGDARDAGDGAQRGGKRQDHHPDSGRKRHRQRSTGQGHPLQQSARAGAADQPELRRPARHAAGKRTVRLRARRIYRCAPPQGRPDREGPRRHAVSRRDRQHLASLQAKLLRVLEEGTFMRLGGTKPIKVDVRIIAATNAILKEAVAKGEFREDLFYRLNVLPLFIPPLRDRKEDILPLALDIMQYYNNDLKKNFAGFTPAAAELLQGLSRGRAIFAN